MRYDIYIYVFRRLKVKLVCDGETTVSFADDELRNFPFVYIWLNVLL